MTTALGVAALVAYGAAGRARTAGDLWLVALIALIPVSELAISLLNSLLTSQIAPRPLPKLALRNGIPARDRTMVVVPAIIDSERRIESLFHDLEVRFLANRDPHLHFALLSDFADAAARDDRRTMTRSCARPAARVDELNDRHGARPLLPVSPRAAVECRRSAVDGMGTQARQARSSSTGCCAAPTDTSFVVQHGDLSILRVDQVRDHARFRHAAADGERRAGWSAPCRIR